MNPLNLLPSGPAKPSGRDCSMFPAGFNPNGPKLLRLRKLAKFTQRKVDLYWDALDTLAIANLQGGASTVHRRHFAKSAIAYPFLSRVTPFPNFSRGYRATC